MMRPICSSLVARGGRLACRQGPSKVPTQMKTRRGMANDTEYPSSMAVHKNRHIEEWNGAREVTEETFEFTWENAPTVFAVGIAFPYFVYWITRTELKQNGDRHFDDLL